MIANRTAWLRERQQCVMATDIPRLCGVYFDGADGPARVYAEKVADAPIEGDPSLRMRLGTFLEPFVAELLADATGSKLVKLDGITRHKLTPWIAATLDREVYPHGWPAECKVVFSQPDEDYGPEGSDKLPDRMALQVQWQMHAAGSDAAFVGVLFAPYCFRWFRMGYDSELCDMLVAIAADFNRRVVERRGMDDWRPVLLEAALKRVEKAEPNRIVMLGQKELDKAKEFFDVVQPGLRDFEGRFDRLKGELLAAMGTAEYALLPDRSKLKRSRTIDKLTRVKPKRVR